MSNNKNEVLLLLTDRWCQVVVNGGFITANETAAVEFAYNIFKTLEIDSDEEIEQWYDNFKNGAVR